MRWKVAVLTALICDPRTEELVARIDFDFVRIRVDADDQVMPSLRMGRLDRAAQAFLAAHPDGVVVHIGCSLGTRFDRVCAEQSDNGQAALKHSVFKRPHSTQS